MKRISRIGESVGEGAIKNSAFPFGEMVRLRPIYPLECQYRLPCGTVGVYDAQMVVDNIRNPLSQFFAAGIIVMHIV